MKRIYDFCYCQGEFSPTVVWYLVKVGTSGRDAAALRQLCRLASQSPHIMLAHHDASMADLREAFARAIFPGVPRPVCLLRTKSIEVVALARFVRHYPLALLNSARVDTPVTCNDLMLSGWKTPADIVMSRKVTILSR